MNYEELIAKAKEAKSVEDLLTLAKANGVELSEEEAKLYFAQIQKSGELSDEELDNVSGGGCKTSGGQTVVSSGKHCFTGQYSTNWYWDDSKDIAFHRTDNLALRKLWFYNSNNVFTDLVGVYELCGSCSHLEFKGGTGYCGKT